jgi:DNA repair protein RecN (Recombination protein N)
VLKSLYIRDYALIRELEVEFGPGLNIITGETGAGKSILIGGLKLILGERAQSGAIRTGSKKAIVEGVFDVSSRVELRQYLIREGFDDEPELILRREVRESQSRAFVNDSPASLSQLRLIASGLVDLHGQHEHQSLLRTGTHGQMVDAVGDNADGLLLYQSDFETASELNEKRLAILRRSVEQADRAGVLSFQIEEIDAVAPKPGEIESIEAEIKIVENAETLYTTTGQTFEDLYGSDSSVIERLAQARESILELSRIDPFFEAMAGEIESARISIDEVSGLLQDYHGNIEFNSSGLESMRERLSALDVLCRRYGGTLEAVAEYRSAIGEEFDIVSDLEGALSRVDSKLESVCERLSTTGWDLSGQRNAVARLLESRVVEQLRVLGMENARFSVEITQEEQEDGWIRETANNIPAMDATSVDVTAMDTSGMDTDRAFVETADPLIRKRYKARRSGIDRIEFMLSANTGEPLAPLEKVASGGEISRIMLALKAVLAGTGGVPVLVFDEIDSGISGAIAHRVGERLDALSNNHQLLVITHLPQVAARATDHFRVSKRTDSDGTETSIVKLNDNERQTEIATLLSGEAITEAALQSARELIKANPHPQRF